jgi:arylsulfatase A-like enzyme
MNIKQNPTPRKYKMKNSSPTHLIKIIFILFSIKNVIQASDKPNVLFLAIDDLRNFVNCFGYEQAITPNLDRLAKRSTIFTNAHNQAPMCGPSRTSCMTGTMPHVSGAYGFVDLRKVPYLKKATTLNRHFKNNGYQTYTVGKIYHGNTYIEGDWTKVLGKAMHKGGTWASDSMKKEDLAIKSYFHGKKACGPSDIPEEKFHDTITADIAVKQLQAMNEQPWFLAVGFTKPHLPWVAPRKYFDMYNEDELILPEILENDIQDTPDAAQFASYQIHSLAIDREKGAARRLLHSYLATITYMDAQLGKVLDALGNREDAQNTAIALWSDHGWHLGEKQCWSKFTLWRESTLNPMMLSFPGQTKANICNKPVQLVDLYPTLIDICKLNKPQHQLDGRSVTSLMKNPDTEWPYPAITCNGRDSYSLTFERYKYNRFFDGSEELYDHHNDPLEHKNLADTPAMESIKNQCMAYLPQKSAPNVSDSREWMLWLEDYPRLVEWRKEMSDIKKGIQKNGKVNHYIFRRYCRKSILGK